LKKITTVKNFLTIDKRLICIL